MSNRAMKHVSELYFKLRSNMTGRIDSPDDFNKKVQSMFYNIGAAVERDQATADDIKHPSGNEQWVTNMKELQRAYRTAFLLCEAMSDHEQYALSIEKRANLIALFYRFLTTIAVGLGIMGIYWLAHVLCIPMPLMRVPL